MKKYKVCHLITDSVIIGGAETFLVNLTPCLANRYEQIVICLTGNGPLLDRLRSEGIDALTVDVRGKADLPGLWRLLRLLRKLQPDILHTHLFHASLLGAILGRLTGVPVILSTEHTAGISGRRAFFVRLWTSLSDKAVAVSEAVRQALVAAGASPSKVELIVNGLPLAAFHGVNGREGTRAEFGISPDALVIGKVAGFRPVKGHEYLVRSFAQVAAVFPKSVLLLIGDGVQRPAIEQLVRELGLTGRVVFAGFRQDVPGILASLDVFALSSLWEGMPLCVLEAMAAGLPVVASGVSGIPEVVVDGETGLLVPPGDSGALAGALIELLADPARARAMGEAGRQRVDASYDIENTADSYHQLYQRLLHGR